MPCLLCVCLSVLTPWGHPGLGSSLTQLGVAGKGRGWRAPHCLCVRSLLRAPRAVVTTPPCWLCAMCVRRPPLPWSCSPSLRQSGAGQLQAGRLSGFGEADPHCSALGLFSIDVVMSRPPGPQTIHGGPVTDIHRGLYCSCPACGGPLLLLSPPLGIVSGGVGVRDLAQLHCATPPSTW